MKLWRQWQEDQARQPFSSDLARGRPSARMGQSVPRASRSRQRGQSGAAACKAIGMHQATVSEWRKGPRRRAATKKTKRPTRVRPVEVAVGPGPVSSSLTLQFPGGARVEGLELADVVELARALR